MTGPGNSRTGGPGSASVGERPPWWVPLVRGLRLRCPACGQAPIYRTVEEAYRRCPACGAYFDQDGEFVGAMVIAYGIIAAVVGLGVGLSELLGLSLPLWVHMALWTAVALAILWFGYRPCKGLFLALVHLALGLGRDERQG